MLKNFKCAQSHHDHYFLNQQSELHLDFLDLDHTFHQQETPEKGLLQRFEEMTPCMPCLKVSSELLQGNDCAVLNKSTVLVGIENSASAKPNNRCR